GSIVLGDAFFLTPEEREGFVASNELNAERIFPHLGGKEINTSSTQAHGRYVISFGQMSMEEAGRWPDLFRHVHVRLTKASTGGVEKKAFWWRHVASRPALYSAITPLRRCLVTSGISKHRVFTFQPTTRIFSHNVYVFPFEDYSAFAVLQSRLHVAWTELLASGLEDRGGYRPSDCFDTFPFPQLNPRARLDSLE